VSLDLIGMTSSKRLGKKTKDESNEPSEAQVRDDRICKRIGGWNCLVVGFIKPFVEHSSDQQFQGVKMGKNKGKIFETVEGRGGGGVTQGAAVKVPQEPEPKGVATGEVPWSEKKKKKKRGKGEKGSEFMSHPPAR